MLAKTGLGYTFRDCREGLSGLADCQNRQLGMHNSVFRTLVSAFSPATDRV